MPDYKEMYFDMFRAAEQAVNLLVAAQRRCEELYISSPEPDIHTIPSPPEKKDPDKE